MATLVVSEKIMRLDYNAGELAIVEEGYTSGIWLRDNNELGQSKAIASSIPAGDFVMILEVEGEGVRVLSRSGTVGWTWTNRLRGLW